MNNMNTIIIYEEEKLLKTLNGKFIVEAYNVKREGCSTIGLCTNSSPVFCRIQNDIPDSDCSWMEILTLSPSILKHDEVEKEYNLCCPKIAWGITAYLYFYSHIDSKGRRIFKINQKITNQVDIFHSYYNLCKEHYATQNREDYDFYQFKGETDNFNREFLEKHIQQEEFLINKNQSHNLSELIELGKEYIEWAKECCINNKPANSNRKEYSKYSNDLLDLFNGNEKLINELIGKSDDEKAQLIREWNKGNDGKPLIKNFKNRLRKEFAKQLKEAGLISESIENFRKKLN